MVTSHAEVGEQLKVGAGARGGGGGGGGGGRGGRGGGEMGITFR